MSNSIVKLTTIDGQTIYINFGLDPAIEAVTEGTRISFVVKESIDIIKQKIKETQQC